MSENEPPDPLARLGERLDKARSRQNAAPAAGGGQSGVQQGVGQGLRIGVELVVAVVVATGLGWAVDRWLGTRPWATIVLFFLGVAAGMVNVYRAVTGVRMAVGYRAPGGDAGRQGRRRDDKDAWDDEE
jgi:ATP synthase protein I